MCIKTQKILSLQDTSSKYFETRRVTSRTELLEWQELHEPKAKRNFGYSWIKILGAKAFNKLPKVISQIKTEKGFKRAVNLQLLTSY